MKCIFKKQNGDECNSFAMSDSKYCWRHSPHLSEEEKREYSSRGGKSHSRLSFACQANGMGEEGWGGGSPLPEIKINKLDDLACLLIDTINNMRAGKISQKFGSSFGYLSFILLLVMEKAEQQNERERINKLKAEGKWRPEPVFGKKLYTYKDDFFLDKDGKRLIVEKDGSTFYPKLNFQLEDVEDKSQTVMFPKSRSGGVKIKKSEPRKRYHRSVVPKGDLQSHPERLSGEEREKITCDCQAKSMGASAPIDDPDYHNFAKNDESELDKTVSDVFRSFVNSAQNKKIKCREKLKEKIPENVESNNELDRT